MTISEVARDLAVDVDTCILLIQMTEEQCMKIQGIFVENQTKYLALTERFTSGLNELVQRHMKVDGDMIDKYILDYINCSRFIKSK